MIDIDDVKKLCKENKGDCVVVSLSVLKVIKKSEKFTPVKKYKDSFFRIRVRPDTPVLTANGISKYIKTPEPVKEKYYGEVGSIFNKCVIFRSDCYLD